MSGLDKVADAFTELRKDADALVSRRDALERARKDDWSEEARKAAAEARKSGGGGGKSTVSEATKKIQSASKEQLMHAVRHPNTDPKVRKLVEKELDDRANRGA